MRWFPSPRNDARRTRIHRSRVHRAARPDRGRGEIAATDARQSGDAGRERLRISGAPWVFSPDFIVLGLLGPKLRAGEGQGNRGKLPPKHGCRADAVDIASPGILAQLLSLTAMDNHMNRVLAHTGARYPIVQAPMGWIARSQLASAVSRAGGLGIIETSSGETEACQAEVNKMKALNLPFGVNLPIRFLRDDAMLKFVCNSGVKFVTTSAGSPAKFIAALKGAGITVYHAVPTVETAMKCVEAGVDGLVVEGAEGGGFKNPEEVSTLVLLQGIRARTDVPMIAAGGICDGRGMAAAFALGAEGIQMGTRLRSW